jgi:hypothetical protein
VKKKHKTVGMSALIYLTFMTNKTLKNYVANARNVQVESDKLFPIISMNPQAIAERGKLENTRYGG